MSHPHIHIIVTILNFKSGITSGMVAIKKKLRQKGEHDELEYNEQEECEQESNGEIKNDDNKELKRYPWDESYKVEDQRNTIKFSKCSKGNSKHISDDEDGDNSDEH